jgi:hypothetical protein
MFLSMMEGPHRRTGRVTGKARESATYRDFQASKMDAFSVGWRLAAPMDG